MDYPEGKTRRLFSAWVFLNPHLEGQASLKSMQGVARWKSYTTPYHDSYGADFLQDCPIHHILEGTFLLILGNLLLISAFSAAN